MSVKELSEYIHANNKFTVYKPLPHVRTIKLATNWVSFYLNISKEELCPYRCIGAIVITRHNIDRVEVINVSKQLNNEKEVINLLEDMISTSTDLKEFIKNKSDYFNY